MKRIQTFTDFSGGATVSGDKVGPKGSFLYGRSIDFRKKPNQFSLLPATTASGAGTVNDLIMDMVQVADGSRYAIGNSGSFYKIATNGSVTSIGNLGSLGTSNALIYRQDFDRIIITNSTAASSFYPVSGVPMTPVLEPSKYGRSTSTDINASRSGGTLTTTLQTTLSENQNALETFMPDIEPLYSLKVKVVTKGTGNWTATLHDDANNVLGTSTVSNANLNNNAVNEFALGAIVRMLVKPNARTYHFHLTSTVADGTVASSTLNDLSTIDYGVVANRFVVPNNGFHPTIQFLQYVCFGNERYLSVWEPLNTVPTVSNNTTSADWGQHQLTFPPGYEVCGLALYNEYLAIACEKRSTTATKEYQDGKIFFWDGLSTTYNFFVDVPEGSPYSLNSYKNVLYWFAGDSWWGYSGAAPVKLKTFPNTDSEFSSTSVYTVVYPNMGTVRKGVLLMGYPSETSNQSVEHGIYSWGQIDKNYPNSFGYSYPISTGTRTNNGTNNLRVGMIKNFGDTLYMSWRDDSASPHTYGLDIVNNSSLPFSNGAWESLISDNGTPFKQKNLYNIFAIFKSLPVGTSITMKYQLDRNGWVFCTPVTSGTYAKFDIGGPTYYDVQIGVEITTSAALPPQVLSAGFEFEDNALSTKILDTQ